LKEQLLEKSLKSVVQCFLVGLTAMC